MAFKIKKTLFNPVLISEVLYIAFFIGSLMIKCFYFQFTTKLNNKPFISDLNIKMLGSSFSVILIVVALTLLLFNKKRKIALFVLDLLLTLIIIADTVYFRYYYNAISVPVLYQIGLIGSIEGSVKSLLKIKDIIYILDIPFLLCGLIVLNRLYKKGSNGIHIIKRIIITLVLVLIGFAIFKPIYAKVGNATFAYDNNYISKTVGVYYFHYYDTKRFIKNNLFRNKVLTKDEKSVIDNYYKSKKKYGKNYRGTAKGRNLIVVQVEALQQFVLNKKINGKYITPNLDKLIGNSLYFDNFYYQVEGGNTSDAELLCNASLYPVKEGAVFFRYPMNTYYTLPKSLKSQGYKSYAFHANNPSFWNRTEMFKSMGFDTFISYYNYKIDEFVGWGGWALSDTSFFRQSLDKIDTTNPFYGFLITLSSHHPFSYFKNSKNFYAGEYEGTYLGNYFKAINYTDNCIGQLIDDLKKRGLYENTMLVIYGDHFAVPMTESKDLMRFMGITYSDFEWWKLQRVPLFIHYPGMESTETISTTGGEIDLFPTIANLMDLDSSYALGKDLLNTEKGYAVLKNGTVVTDKYLYNNALGQVFDVKNGTPLAKKDYENEIKSLQNERVVSELIIEKNALKSLAK